MARFSNRTLEAVNGLALSVDGCHSIRLYPAEGFTPKGERQDCDAGFVRGEWVNQSGPGFGGDDFSGTVTWRLGDFYLVAAYQT